MYNKFIVIITAENKERFIFDTINSCLRQKNSNNIDIYIVFSKLKNEIKLKLKFNKYKNIKFLKVYKKKIPTQDQIFKIQSALKYIKRGWILLLDGDDKFIKKKIEYLKNYKLKKEKIYLNNHKIINTRGEYIAKNKIYKKFGLYKKLFNDWPERINTSSIIIDSKILKDFYKKYNPYKWKFLAIDVQLILYFHYRYKFEFIDKVLTLKLEGINNLDYTFNQITKRSYWHRRLEQHLMTKQNSKKKNYIDYFLTKIIIKFFFN